MRYLFAVTQVPQLLLPLLSQSPSYHRVSTHVYQPAYINRSLNTFAAHGPWLSSMHFPYDGPPPLPSARTLQHAFWQQMGSHIQEQVDGRRSIYARHHWWIIEPNCTFRKIWDIVQALFLFYVAAVVPVRVGCAHRRAGAPARVKRTAFSSPSIPAAAGARAPHPPPPKHLATTPEAPPRPRPPSFEIPVDGVPYIVDLCVDSYWYADLLLNFITAYEQEVRRGEDVFRRVVYSPQHIARNYARTWFVFDLLAQMPVDTILRAVDGTFECSLEDNGCPDQPNTRPSLFRLFKLLRLARLVKLLRLIRITRLFERYQDDFFRFLPMLAILKARNRLVAGNMRGGLEPRGGCTPHRSRRL